MHIESLKTFLIGKWCLLEIQTNTGLIGIGEGGVHGFPQSVKATLDSLEKFLVGKNPMEIEHIWQTIYRFAHFRGAVITSAISAIDIALWDIKAKYFQVPIYELIGGKTRNKTRLYMHINGETIDDLCNDAKKAIAKGFTAVRLETTPDEYYNLNVDDKLTQSAERVAAVRETVGNDIDVCVEIHRRFSIPETVTFANMIQQYRPFFLEDPIIPDSLESMSSLVNRINIPVATGERFHTIYEFRELLQMRGADYIRPDLCLAGGITNCKKIAAIAESFNIGVIPHNPLSPISTAACVQLDASIPNFILQEYTGEAEPPKNKMVKAPLVLENGYLIVPETPGLGIELNKEYLLKHESDPPEITTPMAPDGSVADW